MLNRYFKLSIIFYELLFKHILYNNIDNKLPSAFNVYDGIIIIKIKKYYINKIRCLIKCNKLEEYQTIYLNNSKNLQPESTR